MSLTATTSLNQRHAVLSSPQNQIELLESLDLEHLPAQGDFTSTIRKQYCGQIKKGDKKAIHRIRCKC